MRTIGLFGGTFDPIHLGHLRAMHEVRIRLRLSEVRLLPWRFHALRQHASTWGDLRVEMIRSAVQGLEDVMVDERAFWRAGQVFTYDIMAEIRAENPDASLCMIVGMDAFCRIDRWYRWRSLFDLVHIVVVTRPGILEPSGGAVAQVLAHRRTVDATVIAQDRAGSVLVLPVTALEISGTALRAAFAAGIDPQFLVPESVRRLMLANAQPAPTRQVERGA